MFAVRKPSKGEIIGTSANQIVPPKFHGGLKMLYHLISSIRHRPQIVAA